MKKLISLLLVSIILALALVVPSFAVTPVDVERESSLELQYKAGDELFKGLEIKTYKIANAFADGTFELCGAFEGYPISIYGIESQAEWKTITATLAAYCAADNVQADLEGVTDENGFVKFENIRPGLYLTLSVKNDNDGDVTIFENFITVVPQLSDEGDHNYNVTAYPKYERFIPEDKDIEYKVVKQWKDNGASQRPKAVDVEILCEGETVETVKLSAENDWSYTWIAPDDGSNWQVVERNVAEGYTVTVSEKVSTFVVTNSLDGDVPPPPQTGDTFVIWHYVIPMVLSGLVVITVALLRGRKES